ncbi:universal stress protein [Mariniflexile sp.]|uniref:universal stress protein n=1 Tax=Mariniflexile sp. TaxID=1979402 RepID=UPI003565E3B2
MNILVATNFSKLSDNAVMYSASLAMEFKTKLIIFNAFQLSTHASNARLSGASVEVLIENNRSRLEKLALDIMEKFDIKVEYKCSFVSLDQEAERLMEAYNSRLLVIGMSPKSMEQNLLGNPTTTLISMKRFPVLAVPIDAKYAGIKNILFACDLLAGIPLKTLAKLRELAIMLNAKVTVFYVEQKVNELKAIAKDEINNELEDVTILYKNVKSNTVIEAIETELKKSKSDLLVMMPRKYGFWESIMHKSKTRVMASGLNIPLLSIPIE